MTVALAAMLPQPTKRLPSPALQPPQYLSQKLLLRRCPSWRATGRGGRLYRVLTASLFAVSLFFACAQFWRYGWNVPLPSGLLSLGGGVLETHKVWRRWLRLYQRQLHLHPLTSRAVTAGIIFFVADVAAQVLSRRERKTGTAMLSVGRLARYTGYGLWFMGPFLYLWYALMNEYGPEDDVKGSLIKCVFEQLTLEPICISMYIVYDGLVCRKGIRAVRNSLDSQFFPLWFKNAVFWLPANFANYYIGTPDLRVVFANLCSLFWNIYFSGKVNKIGVPVYAPDKAAGKYLPISNHERDAVVTGSTSHHKPSEASSRHPAQTVSAPRVSTKTLVV